MSNDTRGVDVFGIAKLFETSPYGIFGDNKGWEYYSTEWNTQFLPERLLSDSWFIGLDSYLHFKNIYGSKLTVYGDGTNRIKLESVETTSNLQLAIYDNRNLDAGVRNALSPFRGRRWTPNNEFTIYFNKIANADRMKNFSPFMEISLGSDHHFNTSCPYNAHHYTLSILNNGQMCLTGEPYHGTNRGARPIGITDIDFWDTDFTGIPLDKPIGLKLVKRVSGIGKNIFLEVYRDLTDGYHGGTWEKLFEYEHVDGNWINDSMEALYNTSISATDYALIFPKSIDMPHAHDGGMCFIEISTVKELELKWLSCRDIIPVFTPLTTWQELEASGDSGEYESGY